MERKSSSRGSEKIKIKSLLVLRQKDKCYDSSPSREKTHERTRCVEKLQAGPPPQEGSDIIRKSQTSPDLSYVNCHLTPPPPAPSTPPPAPSRRDPVAGQGWRGNFIKGSPVTKAPQKQKGHKKKGGRLFVVRTPDAGLLLLLRAEKQNQSKMTPVFLFLLLISDMQNVQFPNG